MTGATGRLAALATGQLGVFSRQQAHDVDVTDDQLRSRVSSGFLNQIGPNVYQVAGAPSGPLSKLTALVLDVGEPCWVSGRSAAALHGFDGFKLAEPFHLMLPRGRDVHRRRAVIHTTNELPQIDRAREGRLPVLSAARTLIDLARTESRERLTIAFDSGLRDGRFSEDLVHRRIVALRSRGRFGLPKLLEAIEGFESVRGGQSWLEREFLRLLAAAGLPRPDTQQVLAKANQRLVRVDARFPGTPVVVEVLGYRFHRSRLQLNRDAERVNALLDLGLWPYQFTYDQVVMAAGSVIATIVSALARAADLPSAGRREVPARSASAELGA